MDSDMTVISENNISFLKGGEKTPQEVAAFLREGAKFRNFGTILSKFCPDRLREKLTVGLAELAGEEKNASARKVRNWLNGKNTPHNRETLFQICFILHLNEEESNALLAAVSDTGIHYRNPNELAYAYALRMEMTYQKAVELKQKAVSVCESAQKPGDAYEETVHTVPMGCTRQIREKFCDVSSEEEFLAFFSEHGWQLGMLHETAYLKFMELLDVLMYPKGQGGDGDHPEQKLTLEQIMQEYLRMHVPIRSPKEAGRLDLTPLQKLVKRCWPNEGELTRMRTRQEDVSRKTLILLYLVTEAFDMDVSEEEDDYFYEDLEEDADTMLEIRWKRMDMFLDAFGMNHLDVGNPFDFLALYAMRAQEGDYASDRMEQMMEAFFS